jgi:tight adherence protein B
MRTGVLAAGFLSVGAAVFWLASWVGVLAAAILTTALFRVRMQRRQVRRRRTLTVGWQRSIGRIAGALESGSDVVSAIEVGAGSRLGRVGPGSEARSSNDPRDVLLRTASWARLGGEIGKVLAAQPIHSANHLAMAFRASRELGLAVRPVLVQLAQVEYQRSQVDREVDVALVTARATTRLLALLPLIGLGLMATFDLGALRMVFGTSTGRGCLLLASVFEAAGLLWTEALTVRAST